MRGNDIIASTINKENPKDHKEFIETVLKELREIKGTPNAFSPTVASIKGIWDTVNKDHNKSINFTTADWVVDAVAGFKCIVNHGLNSSNTMVRAEEFNGMGINCSIQTVDANTIAMRASKKFNGRCIINTGYFGQASKVAKAIAEFNYKEISDKNAELLSLVERALEETEKKNKELDERQVTTIDIPGSNFHYNCNDNHFEYLLNRRLPASSTCAVVTNPGCPVDSAEARIIIGDKTKVIYTGSNCNDVTISITVSLSAPMSTKNNHVDAIIETDEKFLMRKSHQEKIDEICESLTAESIQEMVSEFIKNEITSALKTYAFENKNMSADSITDGVFNKILKRTEYTKLKNVIDEMDMVTEGYVGMSDLFISIDNRIREISESIASNNTQVYNAITNTSNELSGKIKDITMSQIEQGEKLKYLDELIVNLSDKYIKNADSEIFKLAELERQVESQRKTIELLNEEIAKKPEVVITENNIDMSKINELIDNKVKERLDALLPQSIEPNVETIVVDNTIVEKNAEMLICDIQSFEKDADGLYVFKSFIIPDGKKIIDVRCTVTNSSIPYAVEGDDIVDLYFHELPVCGIVLGDK